MESSEQAIRETTIGYIVSYFKNSFVKTCLILLFLSIGEPFFLLSVVGLFIGFFSFIEMNMRLALVQKIVLVFEGSFIAIALN